MKLVRYKSLIDMTHREDGIEVGEAWSTRQAREWARKKYPGALIWTGMVNGLNYIRVETLEGNLYIHIQ